MPRAGKLQSPHVPLFSRLLALVIWGRTCLIAASLASFTAHADLQLSDGPLVVALDDAGRIGIAHSGKTLINYEQLQLIDRKQGWGIVFGYGKTKRIETSRAGTKVTCRETLPDVLSYTKTVNVTTDKVVWSLRYAAPADTGATDSYYFLDIPAKTLYGTVFRAQTPNGPRFGEITEGKGTGPLSPITGITFYSAERELQFDLGGRNVEWRLTDWTSPPHASFRLRIEKPMADAAVDAEATVALTVRAGAADVRSRIATEAREFRKKERQVQLTEAGLRSTEILALAPAGPVPQTIRQYDVFAFDFGVGGAYDNPFDPDQIDVTAEFRTPRGQTIVRPAYFQQDFVQTAAGVARREGASWRVRFTPTFPGRHTYRIQARNRDQEKTGLDGSFECTPRQSRGFVRVSKSNPLYCEFENGEPYVPSGINVFYMTRLGREIPEERLGKCLGWMSKLADNGGNFVRLRMDSWWLAAEMTPDVATGYLGLGYYHQRTCWEIDRIYELAARRDLQVMHCLDNANGNVNASRQSWRRMYDLYIEENGGVCDQPTDFWSHPEARRTVRNKLRYCVARWGGHPNLMAWEFWNEVSCREPMIDGATAWHRDMGRYLRSIDCHAHPITTSLMGDKTLADQIWALPEMEIIQHHFYGRTELVPGLLTLTRPPLAKHGKPFFVGEYGVAPQFKPGNAEYDPTGVQLHNGMWGALFAGGAGAGAWWYVNSYLDKFDLYTQYRPLAEFARRVPWTTASLRRYSLPQPTFDMPPKQRHFEDIALPVSAQYAFKIPPVTRIEIDAKGALSQPEMLRGQLNCAEGRKAPPTFVTTFDHPVDLIIRVTTSVGDQSNKLLVTMDGKAIVEKAFPAGKEADPKSEYIEAYENWRTPYDERVVISIPAGTHETRPEAIGKDRLEVEYGLGGAVAFEDMAPLRALGSRTDDAVYAWFQNRSNTWRRLWDDETPIPLDGMLFECPELPRGSYSVTWFNTWTGKTTQRENMVSSGKALRIAVPPVARDVACLIERVK